MRGIPFSARVHRALISENIIYVGDLVQRTEAELLRIPEFGRKSLNEVKARLREMRLRLGMDLPDRPPLDLDGEANIADAARRAMAIRQAPLGVTFEAAEYR